MLLLVLVHFSIDANTLRQLINYKSKSILCTINECNFVQVKSIMLKYFELNINGV